MRLTLSVPSEFVLKSTVMSHGWCQLPPFSPLQGGEGLERVIELASGKLLPVSIIEKKEQDKRLLILASSIRLARNEHSDLKHQIKTCLRLDEDFSGFYQAVKKHDAFRWVFRLGAGRLLRSPTVWEDMVKMLLTTNCSWALTKIMTENLCKKLGRVVDVQDTHVPLYAFPSAEAVAQISEKFLRKEIRVGYRARYLLELAKKVTSKQLDIEAFRTREIPTIELFKAIRSVKGIGPYAAGNLLKLLGHYDYLAIDSWCRKQYFEKYKNGKKVTDRMIEQHYQHFDTWRGLFFWLDLTEYWYNHEIVL